MLPDTFDAAASTTSDASVTYDGDASTAAAFVTPVTATSLLAKGPPWPSG